MHVFTALMLGSIYPVLSSALHFPRQATTTPVPTSTVASSGTAPPTATPVSGVTGATTTGFATQYTFTDTATSYSLAATNPTAVPLSSIVSGAPPRPTPTLHPNLVATPGASPPISGAPPLPTFVYKPGTFPALDLTPPVNSPQVQQWIQEVKNSGISIPDYSITNPGGCSNNSVAMADTARCYWTCGHCVRPTDIVTCPDKLTWGLSYDDGPSNNTPDLLNFLDSVNLKSTLFIVGSRAISRPDILQAEYMAGHQLSVHTWAHPLLTTLTNEQVIAELGWTREAIKQITGVTPNTMRPPYGDIDDRVRAISMAMGMTPIIWTSPNATFTFDTNDWHIPAGQSPQGVLSIFDNILNTAATLDTGFIVLAHDLFQQTVDLAVGYVLPDAMARRNPQYTLKPIISCLNKPLSDAYRETNNNQTNPVTSAAIPASPTSSGSGSSSTSASRSSALAAFTPGVFFMTMMALLSGLAAFMTAF